MKIEELKKIIISAVPEIIAKYEEEEVITEQIGCFTRQSTEKTGRKYIYERDITLEDVLMVMDVSGNNKVYIDEDKKLIALRIINDWELNKPFYRQNKETIDFIYDIIILHKVKYNLTKQEG